MTNRRPFRDNPSPEEQLAVIFERLDNFMKETRSAHQRLEQGLDQQSELMASLLRRETERNGHISDLIQSRDDIEMWTHKHDDWHGPNDQAIKGRISERLILLEGIHHDQDVRHGVWLSQWKAFTACAGAGSALTLLILRAHDLWEWLFAAVILSVHG